MILYAPVKLTIRNLGNTFRNLYKHYFGNYAYSDFLKHER